ENDEERGAAEDAGRLEPRALGELAKAQEARECGRTVAGPRCGIGRALRSRSVQGHSLHGIASRTGRHRASQDTAALAHASRSEARRARWLHAWIGHPPAGRDFARIEATPLPPVAPARDGEAEAPDRGGEDRT